MKTSQELLDFYGVELGKKYKITDESVERILSWVGRTFEVKKGVGGELVIKLSVTEAEHPIHMLDDYVYEEAKELLTDEEKNYLRAVIKPFRDSIITIEKPEFPGDKACIQIEYRRFDGAQDRTYMPMFNINDLYLGMKKNKKYTLKELGL